MLTDSMTDGFPNQLSIAIGELRNYAAAQSEINKGMLAELQKIGERLSGIGELNATFATYRGTLHERFNHLHETLLKMDLDTEKTDHRSKENEDRIRELEISNSQIRFALMAVYTLATLSGPVIAYLFPLLLKTISSQH